MTSQEFLSNVEASGEFLEFGVTIGMAGQTGPFAYHLTRKLVELCRANDIRFQKDIFRYYRSDSALALEAGVDVRTALITFGVAASHGYERIHALRSLAERVTAYVQNPVQIKRDAQEKPGEPAASPPSRPRRPISR